jgi:hypothetical protein
LCCVIPPENRDADPTWLFARVPESKTVKNRLHLDVIAADPEVEIARLVQLGATRVADRDETGTPGRSWLTQKVTSSTSGRRCELGCRRRLDASR